MSSTTPARARERNFTPNLHARPVPPLSRRDSGFQGCRIGFGYLNCIGIDVDAHGFRRGVINQHLLIRARVQGGLQPFLFPAKLTPDPVQLDPSARPCFSCRTRFLPLLPSSFPEKKLYKMYIDLIVSLPLIHLSLNLGSSHDDIFQSSSSIINLYSVQDRPVRRIRCIVN